MSWRNIAGLAGATSKDKYRLQWHALCPLLGREHCAIRSRAKFTSTAYEIIVNSSVPVSSRLVSARSCVFLLPPSRPFLSSGSLPLATFFPLFHTSCLATQRRQAHRTGRYQGFNLSACGYILFISLKSPGKSRRIYNRNVHRSFDPVLFLFLNYLLINGTNPISVQTWKNKSAISIRANLKNVGNNLAICKAEELRSKN